MPNKNNSTEVGSWAGGLPPFSTARLYLYQRLCIFMVAFLVFANGIGNSYNIDDIYYTTDLNPVATMGIKGIPKIFTERTLHDNLGNQFDYRPVPMLSFALQHQFINGDAATGHFINVLLYALLCVLLFSLLRRWTGDANGWLVFFAVLLYAVHPLHTEVVDSIKSRDELLASLFGLLMLRSVWLWYQQDKKMMLVAGVVFLLLGALCKTTVAIYLMMVPVAFYFFTDFSWKKTLVCFALLYACAACLKLGSKAALPEQQRVFALFENPFYTDQNIPFAVRTATASYVLGKYAWLHVFPYPLSFYYGYSHIPLFMWSRPATISALVYIGILWVAIRGFKKKTLLSFAALYYLVGIMLFSNLVYISPGIMADRFTFASSMGYCLLLVAFLYQAFKVLPANTFVARGRYVAAIVLLVCCGYAGMTMERNRQWRDTWTLYSHDIRHLQTSVKANMFYGEQIMYRMNALRYLAGNTHGEEQKTYLDSLVYFQKEQREAYLRAIAVVPDYYEALENLGVAYINMDSFDKARECLVKARTSAPGKASIHSNLAIAFVRDARADNAYLDSGIASFEKAISIYDRQADAYGGLTQSYLVKGDTAIALKWSLQGIQKVPGDVGMYMQTAQLYLYTHDTDKAIYYLEKGAIMPQPDPRILSLLKTLKK